MKRGAREFFIYSIPGEDVVDINNMQNQILY
jgi:hypothetical protein